MTPRRAPVAGHSPSRGLRGLRRRPLLAPAAILGCLCLLAGLTGGCSSPPKSGKKKRTVLMTEYDDASVGEEAAKDVEAQMGILPDQDLNDYVSEIGLRLLRGVPRRPFHYRFAVVDEPEPNAFALPGGYIFVSRGLMALAETEDELACVIGHEITHAAHRHAAAAQGLERRANPLTMPWIRAARSAAYGRDMERDADKGGQILCAAAGYDPMALSTFLERLGQYERLQIGYSRGPSFFATHPGSTERAAVNAARASEMRWQRDPTLGDTRQSLLAKVNGIALGQRPQAGVFQGDTFLHPDLDFLLRFPRGWQTSNTNSAVGAAAPRGDAVVFLTADLPKGEPGEVAKGWADKTAERQRITVVESKPVKVGHIDSWRMRIDASAGMMGLTSYVTFIPYERSTYRITGLARAATADQYLGRTLATSRSFRPLTEEERHSIIATNLELVRAHPGEGIEALSERTGNAWDVNATAVYNGVFIDHRFEGGEWVKVAKSEPYVPKPRPPAAGTGS